MATATQALTNQERKLAQLQHELCVELGQRQHGDDELRRFRRQQELILDSAAEGIQVVGLDGTIVFENAKAAELLGWHRSELIGKPAHATMHHTCADGSPNPVENCPIYTTVRDGKTRRITNEIFWRKDGTSFPVEYTSAALKDDDNDVTGVVIVFRDLTADSRAQEQLREAEREYRELFNRNPNAMWVYEPGTLRYLEVNEAAQRTYGYTREEFLSMTLADIRPSEDLPKLRGSACQLGDAEDEAGVWRHRRKDGTELFAEIYDAPITFRGQPQRLVTAVDVTERERAATTMRESNQRFEVVARATTNVIWDWDMLANTLWWNDQLQSVFGYAPELNGDLSSWTGRLHPDDVTPVLEGLEASLAAGATQWSDEYRFCRSNGEYAVVADRACVLRDEKGKAFRMIGAMVDITEQRQADERLRQQAEIIDHAHDAIIVRDFETDRVTCWNKGAERLYGFSAAEAMGQCLADLLQAREVSREEVVERLLSSGEFHGQLTDHTKSGLEVIVDARITLMRDAAGHPRSILGINTDVTEQKKLEQQFLRAQRLESIGTLASGVAHDLNNIITPILMSACVLREGTHEAGEQQLLDLIEQSATRGAAIVKQVLTFARGVEGARVLVQPVHLISEVAKLGAETLPKNIFVRTSYKDGLWSIEGDPTQLHQVLLNFCVNARDAMPNGGTLTIGAANFTADEAYAAMIPDAKPGPYVLLSVTDTGAGIPRDMIDKIFDPFFTTKEIGKGTGLGLSTVIGIVKSHGGFVNVYSEVNAGTTFKVYLPATVAATEVEEPAESITRSCGNGELILVVDDEEAIRCVTDVMLRKHNYRVLTAADGPEALALFATRMNEVAVVLSDIAMPYMDGIALSRALKKMKPDLPIIASTGRSDDPRIAELQAAGAHHCLTKPYNIEALLGTLREVLHHSVAVPA